MVRREHVMPFMGQRVVVHTNDGAVHHGVLHSVTRDGIYLRGTANRTTLVSAEASEDFQSTNVNGPQMEQTWFPFFFLPWLALAAVYPWGYGW